MQESKLMFYMLKVLQEIRRIFRFPHRIDPLFVIPIGITISPGKQYLDGEISLGLFLLYPIGGFVAAFVMVVVLSCVVAWIRR